MICWIIDSSSHLIAGFSRLDCIPLMILFFADHIMVCSTLILPLKYCSSLFLYYVFLHTFVFLFLCPVVTVSFVKLQANIENFWVDISVVPVCCFALSCVGNHNQNRRYFAWATMICIHCKEMTRWKCWNYGKL